MKLLRVLSFLLLVFLGTFYTSGLGHSLIIISEGDFSSHSHNIPDHEIHHSEDIVSRGSLVGNNDRAYIDAPEYKIYFRYRHDNISYDNGYISNREKIFDKQSFFFSDTIRLLL